MTMTTRVGGGQKAFLTLTDDRGFEIVALYEFVGCNTMEWLATSMGLFTVLTGSTPQLHDKALTCHGNNYDIVI